MLVPKVLMSSVPGDDAIQCSGGRAVCEGRQLWLFDPFPGWELSLHSLWHVMLAVFACLFRMMCYGMGWGSLQITPTSGALLICGAQRTWSRRNQDRSQNANVQVKCSNTILSTKEQLHYCLIQICRCSIGRIDCFSQLQKQTRRRCFRFECKW